MVGFARSSYGLPQVSCRVLPCFECTRLLEIALTPLESELRDLGIKDYQVPALLSEHLNETLAVENVDGDTILSFLQWVYHVVHLLLLLSFAAFPMLLLNLPVGILAGIWSESRRKKALARSKVKIRGYDVRAGGACLSPFGLSNEA